ncbi:MAG: HEAT repeat domain-containing protein [Sedimentisphaerales bacterium]|nr:HEAT repeat domain-containing protein [Sedimentisphaerales bacterium]
MRTIFLVLMLYGIFVFGVGCDSTSTPLSTVGLGVSRTQLETRLQIVLNEAIADDDPIIRCHGLETLALRGGTPAQQAVLVNLTHTAPAVRFAAAVAAGDAQVRQAQPVLNHLLKDESLSVRLAAGYAMEKLGDKRFTQWFDNTLFSNDAQVAAQACMLIGKLGETPLRSDSRSKLWRVLRKPEQYPLVKLQAAEALGRLGDKNIIPKLLVFAGSAYADDRLIAISGLEAIGGPEALSMLTVLADDPQLEVRLGAIRALGKHAQPQDLDLVRKSVTKKVEGDDPNDVTRVRGLALLALGALGEAPDAGLLYQAMADDNPITRIAAARATIDYLRRPKL